MANDRMRGDWSAMKGNVRQQWNKLTDEDIEAIEHRLVSTQTASAIIHPAVGEMAEDTTDDTAIERIALNGQRTNCYNEAVQVIFKRNRIFAVDGLGDGAKIVIVGILQTSGDLARPDFLRQQAAIVLIA